jgi:cobyrinic acid a,c-diamide synthase
MMKPRSIPAILIAAPKSNSGKTLVTLGLIKALRQRKLSVQPFKCGPDYIDTMHHTNISGCSSVNLDIWMSSEEHVRDLFYSKTANCDVAIVEGVMGLFDGAEKDFGSAAHISRVIDIPVVLVFDASSMAYGAAPLLYGLKNFDRSISVAGVIFNKVSGPSQQRFLRDAACDAGVNVLGFLPKDDKMAIESRHLGLLLPHESGIDQKVELMAQLIEQNVDLDEILSWRRHVEPSDHSRTKSPNLKIAIARDEAFCFHYQANIDRLAEIGEITYFSPLNDTTIPHCDLMWIPGGYPELHLQKLSSNKTIIDAIKQHSEEGKAIIAECGGMMYLGKTITDSDGNDFGMVQIFDYSTSIKQRKLHLGYRVVTTDEGIFKGHEFHHSSLTATDSCESKIPAKNARGEDLTMPIFRKGNVWSSYMHLYLGEGNKMESFLKQLNINTR